MSFNAAAVQATLVAILSDLIARPSAYPPGDTHDICAYAAERLHNVGYETHVYSRAKGLDNVVARLRSPSGQGPSLVFNAHADTVSVGDWSKWQSDPFRPVLKDGLVYGLGAGNCKGSMAVQLWLAEEIARRGGLLNGEVVFTFVTDEESLGPDGMYYLRESGAIKPDMLVLGAQTDNQLITAERGVLWARVTTHGRAAHAGNPAAGDNAILRMVRLINTLEAKLAPKLAERVDGAMKSTMSIGLFQGGHNTNVVPNKAMMEIDRRLLPSEKVEEAFAELKAVLESAGEKPGTFEVEFLRGTNGFRAGTDGPLVSAYMAAIEAKTGQPARFLNATGVSDGRYFADDNIEIVNFGPGSGAQGHAENESVPVAAMVEAAEIQLDLVDRLLGMKR